MSTVRRTILRLALFLLLPLAGAAGFADDHVATLPQPWAGNQAWQRMRQDRIAAEFLPTRHRQAAYGTALLALGLV